MRTLTRRRHRHRGGPAVVRRLRTLAVLEAVNVVWLPVVAYGVAGLPVTVPNVAGTAPALVLLVQGAAYWSLKARQLTAGESAPAGLHWFSGMRRGNPVLLAASLVVVAAGLAAQPGAASLPGLAFWLLAVAEHVNYFHRQVMHDTAADLARLGRRGLRPSPLARDLRRRQAHRGPAHRAARRGRRPAG